jgi:phosphatidylglycerol lysyltransferase
MTKMLQRILLAQPMKHVVWLVIGLVAIHQVQPVTHWQQLFGLWMRLPFNIIVFMVFAAVVAYGLLHTWDFLALKNEAKKHAQTLSSSVLIQRIITAQMRRALGVEKPPINPSHTGILPHAALLITGLVACVAAVIVASPELFGLAYAAHVWLAAGIFLAGLCALFIRTLKLSQSRGDGGIGSELIKLIVGREYQNWLKPLTLFLPAALSLYIPLSKIVQMSALHFMGIYVLAHMAGVLSRVPGGAGVFDSIFLIFAAKLYPATQVFICLVAYRSVYYCLPLVSGVIAYLLLDIRKNQANTVKTPWALAQLPGQLFQPLVSAWLIALMASYWLGQVPHFLNGIVPNPPTFVAPYINNLLSVVFLIIWRCHWRRIDLAYGLVTGCFIFAAILFALQSAVISSLLCLLMLWIFSSSSQYFYRKSALLLGLIPWSLWSRYCLGGFLLVSATVLLTETNDIERMFISQWLSSEALSPLEKLVFVTTFFAGGLATYGLFTRCDARLTLPDAQALRKYNTLVNYQADTQCHLGLAGDKYFLFSDSGKACITFGKTSTMWIGLGDPVGDSSEFTALIWALAEQADAAGATLVFYKVDAAQLPMYINLGMTAFKLGDEARVKLDEFSLAGSKKLNLRNNYNKNLKDGLVFSVLEGEALTSIMPQLKSLSDQWLEAKSAREKQFSLGFFSADYLQFGAVAVAEYRGEVVAFASLWRNAAQQEVAIDLMRYGHAAPKRVMEFLTLSTLLWAKDAGYHWFNLGMAPLSGLQSHRLACVLHKAGGYLFTAHSRFYNFSGVFTYKEKFTPQWHGRYLIAKHQLQAVVALINVAKLIAGGAKGLIAKD